MKTDALNPFIREQKIPVILKNRHNYIEGSPTITGDDIIENPIKANITSSYFVDAQQKINTFTDANARKQYYNLSAIAHNVLRYIEGLMRYNEDLLKIDVVKFMKEANIKSRTTVYKGIEELCTYGFITPYPKRTYYWINPFRLFKGDRLTKYKDNMSQKY